MGISDLCEIIFMYVTTCKLRIFSHDKLSMQFRRLISNMQSLPANNSSTKSHFSAHIRFYFDCLIFFQRRGACCSLQFQAIALLCVALIVVKADYQGSIIEAQLVSGETLLLVKKLHQSQVGLEPRSLQIAQTLLQAH